MAKSKELVAAKSSTALEPLEDWEKELQSEAKDLRSTMRAGVARISHMGGVLRIDNKPVANNKLQLFVIEQAWSKQYYDEAYVAGAAATPSCYAFGRSDTGLAPHVAAPKKQSASCDTCPHNQFFTAAQGKGKRCKDTISLMVGVQPANPDQYQKVEQRQITVPAGSLKNWSAYYKSLEGSTRTGSPTEALVEIGVEPKGGAYALTFTQLGVLSKEHFKAATALRKGVYETLTQPFPSLADAPEKPKPMGKRKF